MTTSNGTGAALDAGTSTDEQMAGDDYAVLVQNVEKAESRVSTAEARLADAKAARATAKAELAAADKARKG